MTEFEGRDPFVRGVKEVFEATGSKARTLAILSDLGLPESRVSIVLHASSTWEMKGVKSLVIGAGNVGERWIKALLAQDCPTSILETNTETALSVVDRFPVTLERDLHDAIDKVDVVYIATPISSHLEPVLAAIEARKIIMCEKPLTGKLIEATDIQRRVHETGVTFAVGNYYRLNSSIQAIREVVLNGELGAILSIEANYYHDMRVLNKKTGWRVKEGFFYDGGVHPVDLVRWIMGREISTVYAAFGRSVDPDYPHPQHYSLILGIPGSHGIVHLNSRAILPEHGVEIEIVGQRGTAQAHNKNSYISVIDESWPGWKRRILPEEPLPIDKAVSMMNRIARGESDSFDPLPNIDDAVKVMRVLDAAEKSMATGVRTTVDYNA